MRKKQRNHFGNKKHFFIFPSFCLMLIVFLAQSYAQTLSIRGKVSASRYCVQYASVTFIDNADTTRKFSALTDASGIYKIDGLTSVEFNINDLPDKFELAQNYPNPFSYVTAIPYILNKHSDVQITIYDILGREVRKFVIGEQIAGSHNILWDGSNSFGKRVANGIYFCRLQTDDESYARKMILTSGGDGSVSLSQTLPSLLSKVTGQSIQGGNFTVRIENTENTLPLIIPEQFDNVPAINDTTINFNVTYIASATVNLDSVHQRIQGFGAANILQWRPDMTSDEVHKAFGTGPGQIGFSILRLRVPHDLTEYSMSIQIPTAKLAHSLGAIVFASPWTPPAAMKTNNNIVGGELKESCYCDYAAHLNKFAKYMSDHDAPLYAISIQNEPDADVNYESCSWNGTQFLNFMKNNAASIGIRIIMPESQNFVHALSDPTLNDSVAAENVSIIGGHIYGGGLEPYPLATSKGKEIWMTEHLSGENSNANNWNWAFAVAKEINDVMEAGMSAYVWWYIVRYYGPISDGTNDCGRKGEVTKKGYVMSQFSRFIRPGYYRVECNTLPWSCNVYVTAYKDSSSSKAVIVAVNNNSNPMYLAIRIQGSINQFTPYTTTASKNCVQGDDINKIDNRFTFMLEASSITTFVSN